MRILSEWPESAGEAWFQVPQVTREGPEVRWYISAWCIHFPRWLKVAWCLSKATRREQDSMNFF